MDGGTRPDRVHVGPHQYDLVYDKEAINRYSVERGDPCVGQCDSSDLLIIIDPEQAESQIRDTLLHEVLHACCDLIGLSCDVDHDIEEKIILRLAPILLLVLRDNPELVTYLTRYR